MFSFMYRTLWNFTCAPMWMYISLSHPISFILCPLFTREQYVLFSYLWSYLHRISVICFTPLNDFYFCCCCCCSYVLFEHCASQIVHQYFTELILFLLFFGFSFVLLPRIPIFLENRMFYRFRISANVRLGQSNSDSFV